MIWTSEAVRIYYQCNSQPNHNHIDGCMPVGCDLVVIYRWDTGFNGIEHYLWCDVEFHNRYDTSTRIPTLIGQGVGVVVWDYLW